MLLNEIPSLIRGTLLALDNPHQENRGETKNTQGDETMELRPYYDRPISTIDAYVTEILGAVAANFRHWGEYKFLRAPVVNPEVFPLASLLPEL